MAFNFLKPLQGKCIKSALHNDTSCFAVGLRKKSMIASNMLKNKDIKTAKLVREIYQMSIPLMEVEINDFWL